MQVKTISYKRVKNLGNYQTETLEMMAELEAGENPLEATENLKKLVNSSLFPQEKPSHIEDLIPF